MQSESTIAIIGIPTLWASRNGWSRPERPIAKIRLGNTRRLFVNCVVVGHGPAFDSPFSSLLNRCSSSSEPGEYTTALVPPKSKTTFGKGGSFASCPFDWVVAGTPWLVDLFCAIYSFQFVKDPLTQV
eukprot:COSAG02_NODE_17799_length_980_cov_1.208854_2_plen_128_part_00